MLQQFGIVLTYYIFVPKNLSKAFVSFFDASPPLHMLVIFMALIQIPLSYITDITRLAPFNLIANGMIFYGLAPCVCYALLSSNLPTEGFMREDESGRYDGFTTLPYPPFSVFDNLVHLKPLCSKWYLFIGTSVLLFEGLIALLIPLLSSITDPYLVKNFKFIFGKTMVLIVFFYTFFSLINWASFGPDVDILLTTSLPSGAMSGSVQVFYSIAVLLTFPLQNFPALQILTKLSKLSKTNVLKVNAGCGVVKVNYTLKRNVITTVVILALGLVGFVIRDDLAHLVSLIGAFFGIPLAFILPMAIHNKICQPVGLRRVLNLLVIGFGCCAMAGASFITVYSWNDKHAERRR